MVHRILLLVLVFAVHFVNAQQDNYGADQANKRFLPSRGMLGGRTDFRYLELADHPSASGVPLGGIGAGNVELAPDGRFVRIGLNNIHIPMPRSEGAFFALWYKSGHTTHAQRLVRDTLQQAGLPGVAHTTYTGLFPRAILGFANDLKTVQPVIHAYSGLAPHNVKHSSLPVVYFDVELHSTENAEVAIAFSWEDFIGRGLKEPRNIEGMDGPIFNQRDREKLVNGEQWPERPPVATFAEPWRCSDHRGVRQFAAKPLVPVKAGFQNYVQEVALIAEERPDVTITCLPAYDIRNGQKAWKSFADKGVFEGQPPLMRADKPSASAISVKTTLRAGEKKTIRFMLTWFYPELPVDEQQAGSWWPGGSDYGRYFHNYFNTIEQLTHYAVANRALLLEQTMEWQQPILNSSLPDWYKFKLINSAYVIYTNMVLNKKGDVMINEGGMGGLAGTMDQRICSHPFYQKFFTQLDRSEMEIFADAQAPDGSIPHFIGHYYVGMGTKGGRIPTENNWMLDNTEGWIIQLAKDYEQTGDLAYLKKYAGRVKDGMAFLKSNMPKDVQIPVGPTTYDDFNHPPVYSYGAGMYLACLKAAEVIALAMNDYAWVRECRDQFARSQQDMIRLLWNGRFFSYGCEIDGSKRLDQILFTGQLGGQFVSRYCGWGDVLPMDMIRSALVAQFKTSLFHTPDYYANKVWDLDKGKGIDHPGSQCWPFYLESYTGYTALQAGYVADAMDIMKHIQLVHLRKGFTWCQNLWNPAELNYMTAPVTWFSTDVLAGAGLNVPRNELRLAPLLQGSEKLVLPLFFPNFWAMATFDPATKKAALQITKTFGDVPVHIKTIIAEPAGLPAAQRRVIPVGDFVVKTGHTLDLSRWWRELTDAQIQAPVLPQADKVPFMQVDANAKRPTRDTLNYDVFGFYYNWYGNPKHDGKYIHWAHPVLRSGPADTTTKGYLRGGDDIAANFYPALGNYSSNDKQVVQQHMQMISEAGIGAIVVSWWNKNDFTDKSIPLILDEAAARRIKVAFHIEPFGGRNAQTTRAAIEYIIDSYGHHPAFYRSGNKPFFFVYDSYLIPAAEWASLLQPGGSISIRNTKYDAVMIGLWVTANEHEFFLRSGFDGMYTYFASSGFTYGSTPGNWKKMQQWAAAHKKIFIPCVGPGYIDTRVRPWNGQNTQERNGGAYYSGLFEAAIASKAPYIGITSFNEWHEGTQIEPAVPLKNAAFTYLDYGPQSPDHYLQLTKQWIDRFNKKRTK